MAAVADRIGLTKAQELSNWMKQSRADKLKSIRDRSQNVLGADNADEDTLNRLHQQLTNQGR